MKGNLHKKLSSAFIYLLILSLSPCISPANARDTLTATGSIEVAFTPWDDAEGALLNAIQQARQTIHVQAYFFTSRTLARALITAHQRGVQVNILADAESVQKAENTQIPQLAAAGIPVWLETRYTVAHNKIMLFDAESPAAAIATGSYNFTFSAQARNAENLLILRNNPALTARYLKNWRRHHSEATPYSAKQTH